MKKKIRKPLSVWRSGCFNFPIANYRTNTLPNSDANPLQLHYFYLKNTYWSSKKNNINILNVSKYILQYLQNKQEAELYRLPVIVSIFQTVNSALVRNFRTPLFYII